MSSPALAVLDNLCDPACRRYTIAEGVNVEFTGALKSFVERRVGEHGVYGSVSEYIRDLVRRDYEQEQKNHWDALYQELKDGITANAQDFVPLDSELILAEAKRRKHRASCR